MADYGDGLVGRRSSDLLKDLATEYEGALRHALNDGAEALKLLDILSQTLNSKPNRWYRLHPKDLPGRSDAT